MEEELEGEDFKYDAALYLDDNLDEDVDFD